MLLPGSMFTLDGQYYIGVWTLLITAPTPLIQVNHLGEERPCF